MAPRLVKLHITFGLVIIVFIMLSMRVASSCEDVVVLPDLGRRARNYQADGVRGSEPYVDDRYISPKFYSVKTHNGQYLMPDGNSMPELGECGTDLPIYIKGTHPDIFALTNNSIAVTACERSPFSVCENIRTTRIRKCGDDIQYYLQQTSQNSAYCFDPPELQNMTVFQSAPNVQLGKLTVSPKLVFTNMVRDGKEYDFPNITFECKEHPVKVRSEMSLLYSTYWFIDSVLTFSFDRNINVVSLTDKDLLSKGYKLGIRLRCGIRVSSSNTGLLTQMTSSEDFFAGVKVHNKTIYMGKEDVASIILEQTVPFGCHADKNQVNNYSCKHRISMTLPDATQCDISDSVGGDVNTVSDGYARCGVEITGFHPHQASKQTNMPKKSMNVTTPYMSDSDRKKYSFALVTQHAGVMDIWKDLNVGYVEVYIKETDKFTEDYCYSHVDPHMKSRDGRKYENNNFEGEFILYRNIKYHTEVQEKTVSCFGKGRPYCTCAVAVKAGGDVFLINLCNGLKYIGMTSCKDSGALRVEQQTDLEYQVFTSIGTLVKIRIRPYSGYNNLMNIDVHMAPKDYGQTRGLCGTYDGRTNNDFHDRAGTVLTDRIDFIKTWMLRDDDLKLLYPSCNLNVGNWTGEGNHWFCSCNCFKDPSCKIKTKTDTHCGPSQYVNCTANPDSFIESDLCIEFDRKCADNSLKRSAFSAYPEYEMERRAKLARNKPLHFSKRDIDDDKNITEEYAKELCTLKMTTHPSVIQHSKLLRGFNISYAIEDCTYDVYHSQDIGWTEAHQLAAVDAVKVGFRRDANYTATHKEELLEFNKQSCPSNCSGNGHCSEKGVCICKNGYFGPDCRNNISTSPYIQDLEGGGICDTKFGSECNCFEMQVETLSKNFLCQRIYKRQLRNGETQYISTDRVSGLYMNLFTGKCCFESDRKKRSTKMDADLFFYMLEVSLSNDGETFGDTRNLFVYDSTCLTAITVDVGNVTFEMKRNTCLINGGCYEADDVDLNDQCMRCQPVTDQFHWSYDCTGTDNADKQIDKKIIIIIVVTVVLIAGIPLSALGVCMIVNKINKPTRTVSSISSFTDARMCETSNVSHNFQENRLVRYKITAGEQTQ